MSKNKNDKNSIFTFDKLAAHVGLAACSLASIAVIAEAFEHRQPKHAANVPSHSNTSVHAEQPGAGDSRKEEIRHMHISYGVSMRSHPISGSI